MTLSVILGATFLCGPLAPDHEVTLATLRAARERLDAPAMIAAIRSAKPPTDRDAIEFTLSVAISFSAAVWNASGPEEALEALAASRPLIPERKQEDVTLEIRRMAAIGQTARATGFYHALAGRKAEALRVLDEAIGWYEEGNGMRNALEATHRQVSLLNEPAPTFEFDRWHNGDFRGLESYRGKVVIVDFFAHWCGFCLRAMPDIRTMLAQLQPKGLEIFCVTTYYGYFGQDRGIDRDEEFARMPALLKEHHMDWPVVYTERSTFDLYGVQGIPHMVVVDRNGIVRTWKIGYSLESFARFRKEIEALVAEPWPGALR